MKIFQYLLAMWADRMVLAGTTFLNVKSVDRIVAKWNKNASIAGPAYQEGVQNPKKSWAANTSASAQAWQQGVQQAAANGSFANGVNAAGNTGWQTGALQKGVTRYGP